MKNNVQNKLHRWVLLVLTVLMLTGVLCACSDENEPEKVPITQQLYTVNLTAESGQALAGAEVFVYADATLTDLVSVTGTDNAGAAKFMAPPAQSYAVVLKSVPAGYPVEESYVITDTVTDIVLSAQLIADADLSKDKFRLNSVMFDFSVTDTEGNTYTLSELLQQKKAVVLNFWFATCEPCKAEFPFLQQAWESYSDDVALLAVNPVDDEAAVAQFRAKQGLSIPMASVDSTWAAAFDMMYFPTTMVIDRFGNVNLMHVGSVPNAELFENMFACYAAEDYTQRTGLSLEDFAAAP